MSLTSMSEKQQHAAEQEVEFLQKLQHPFIIEFHECFVSPQGVMVVIMEFAQGGSLMTRIEAQRQLRGQPPLAEAQVMSWFVQLCHALQFLHGCHVLHRDLKPDNVFLTTCARDDAGAAAAAVVKLGDFGFSKQINSTTALTHTRCGTPYYLSPEICRAMPYSNKSDVWSLGVVLYELLTLRKPFEGNTLRDLMLVIMQRPYPGLNPSSISAPLRQLVALMLMKSPRQRPSVSTILKHECVQPYLADTVTLVQTLTEERKGRAEASSEQPHTPLPGVAAEVEAEVGASNTPNQEIPASTAANTTAATTAVEGLSEAQVAAAVHVLSTAALPAAQTTPLPHDTEPDGGNGSCGGDGSGVRLYEALRGVLTPAEYCLHFHARLQRALSRLITPDSQEAEG